jgi:hypothetical protein
MLLHMCRNCSSQRNCREYIRSAHLQKVSNVKGLSDAKVDKILAAAAALAPVSGWTNALALTHKVCCCKLLAIAMSVMLQQCMPVLPDQSDLSKAACNCMYRDTQGTLAGPAVMRQDRALCSLLQ